MLVHVCHDTIRLTIVPGILKTGDHNESTNTMKIYRLPSKRSARMRLVHSGIFRYLKETERRLLLQPPYTPRPS